MDDPSKPPVNNNFNKQINLFNLVILKKLIKRIYFEFCTKLAFHSNRKTEKYATWFLELMVAIVDDLIYFRF
jgi:hypothetical protein